MLERLPFWGQIVVMLALAAGLVGLAYYFYPNIQEKNRTWKSAVAKPIM